MTLARRPPPRGGSSSLGGNTHGCCADDAAEGGHEFHVEQKYRRNDDIAVGEHRPQAERVDGQQRCCANCSGSRTERPVDQHVAHKWVNPPKLSAPKRGSVFSCAGPWSGLRSRARLRCAPASPLFASVASGPVRQRAAPNSKRAREPQRRPFNASASRIVAEPGCKGFGWLWCGAQALSQTMSKVALNRPSGSAKRSA